MKEVIITPVENCPFLDAQAASVTLVSLGRITVSLFNLHGRMEKLAPILTCIIHQLVANAVVDDLKEPPFATRGRDLAEDFASSILVAAVEAGKIDDGNIYLFVVAISPAVGQHGAFGWRLDVPVGDIGRAAFGQGLNTNYRFRPILAAHVVNWSLVREPRLILNQLMESKSYIVR